MGSAPLQPETTGSHRRLWSMAGLLLAMLALGAPSASAATLFGTVSSQQAGQAAAPIAGASVTVRDPQTDATVAFATTGVDGSYTVTVPSGTYDVRFDSPPSAVVAPSTVTGIEVDVSRKLDVVLVPAGIVRIAGVVRGPDDAPIASLHLKLYPGTPGQPGLTTDTGPDGSYSFAVAPGRWLVGSDQGHGPAGLPAWWSFSTDWLDVAADRTVDVTLPATASLGVRVLDAGDLPLVGIGVSMTLPGVSRVQDGSVLSFQALDLSRPTDASGIASFRVFDGSGAGAGIVTPGPGTGYGSAPFTTPPVAGDTLVDVHPPASVHLSGVVRGPDGAPLDGLRLRLQTGSSIAASTVTGSDGSFALAAAPGAYWLLIEQRSPVDGWPRSWALSSETFELRADRTLDVTMPTSAVLTVRVLGGGDAPLSGARVEVPTFGTSATFDGIAFPYVDAIAPPATTDANGEARFVVFDGSSTEGGGVVTPAAGSGYGRGAFALPPIAGDTTVVARPPASVHLRGVVRTAEGAPVPGLLLKLYQRGGSSFALSSFTDAAGAYAFEVTPGTYSLATDRGAGIPGLPPSWSFGSDDFAVDVDRTVDVALPTASIATVRVLGSDGAPLLARVDLNSRQRVDEGGVAFAFQGTSSGSTDAGGEVPLAVFDGPDASGGTVTPGGGYPPRAFTVPGTVDDTTVVVQYAPADATPPTVTCDPPPSGWHADEVSVGCRASDAGSGLADPADAAFSLTTSVGDGYEDASAQTGARQVCDRAGNCASVGPVGPIAVDRAAPAFAFDQAADGANGWWIRTPATVHVTATDLNIGALAGCSIDGAPVRRLGVRSSATTREADLIVTGEGRHTVSCSASDTLGHAATHDALVLIDLKAPRAPLLMADRGPDYAPTDWYADAVTATAAGNGDPLLADGSAGSGVDPVSLPAPVTYTTSGSHTATARVADLAGRLSAQTRLTVKVDADPPTTTLTCPAGVLRRGASATARWRDADGESGLAGRATGTLALDTSTAGTFTVEHTALDHVGHAAASSCTYTVA